jgi:hypothetical protein
MGIRVRDGLGIKLDPVPKINRVKKTIEAWLKW